MKNCVVSQVSVDTLQRYLIRDTLSWSKNNSCESLQHNVLFCHILEHVCIYMYLTYAMRSSAHTQYMYNLHIIIRWHQVSRSILCLVVVLVHIHKLWRIAWHQFSSESRLTGLRYITEIVLKITFDLLLLAFSFMRQTQVSLSCAIRFVTNHSKVDKGYREIWTEAI